MNADKVRVLDSLGSLIFWKHRNISTYHNMRIAKIRAQQDLPLKVWLLRLDETAAAGGQEWTPVEKGTATSRVLRGIRTSSAGVVVTPSTCEDGLATGWPFSQLSPSVISVALYGNEPSCMTLELCRDFEMDASCSVCSAWFYIIKVRQNAKNHSVCGFQETTRRGRKKMWWLWKGRFKEANVELRKMPDQAGRGH